MFFLIILFTLCTSSIVMNTTICMLDNLASDALKIEYTINHTTPDKCGNIADYVIYSAHVEVYSDDYNTFGVYEFWNSNIFYKIHELIITKIILLYDEIIINVIVPDLNVKFNIIFKINTDLKHIITLIKLEFNDDMDMNEIIDTEPLFRIRSMKSML